MIKIDNIKEGAKFTNKKTIFEVVSIEIDSDNDTMVRCRVDNGGVNYRNEINDLVDFLNEENCIII